MAVPKTTPKVIHVPTPGPGISQVQRNAKTIYKKQSKLSAQNHAQRLVERAQSGSEERKTVRAKAHSKVRSERAISSIREGEKTRVGSTLIEKRGATRVASEGQIAAIRTNQRIRYNQAAEAERTRGYLIRHTGSKAITSAGEAAAPSANPILLIVFMSFGLILVYTFVTAGAGTNRFFNALNNIVQIIANSKTPLFTREPAQ
jgi:Flp pilus assembly protein TadB